MSNQRTSFSGPIYAILAVAVVGLFGWLLYDPGVNAEGSARSARLEELKTQLGPTEQQSVVWAPWLASESYKIGTVFAGDNYAQAYSGACDNIQTLENQMTLSLGANKRYNVDADLTQPGGSEIKLNGAKAIEYRVTFENAEIAPASRELLEQMYSDPDCLAAVANRPVLVLYGRYKGAETYKLSRTLTGNLSLGELLSSLKAKLGGSALDDSDFTRDGTLIWALTRVHLKDDVNFSGDLTDDQRMLLVEDLTLNEASDYVPIALANTDMDPPSATDLSTLTQSLESLKSD